MKDVKKFLEKEKINIDEILFDDKKLNDLFLNRITYLDKKDIDEKLLLEYDFLPLHIINIIDYVNYDLSNLRENELKQIKEYCNTLYKYSKNHPELLENNPIFKLNKKILISLFGIDILEEFDNMKKTSYEEALKTYEKLQKYAFVSNKDLYILIDYLTSVINTKDEKLLEMQEKLVKIIIDNNLDRSLRTKNFIMQFIAQTDFKKRGFDYKIYLSDNNDVFHSKLGVAKSEFILINASKFRDVPISTFFYENYKNIMEYNEKIKESQQRDKIVQKKYTMFNFVSTIYHELWHAFQLYKLQKGIVDSDSLSHLEDYLISKYIGEKYENMNYPYKTSEKDARIYSYECLEQFYKNFLPSEVENIKVITFYMQKINEEKKQYSFKHDDENNVIINEIFTVNFMDRIIGNNSEILTEFPVLKLIYDENGKPLNISKLISNSKGKGFEFEKYTIARILNKDLKKLNIENMEYEELKNIINALIQIMKNTIKSLNIVNGCIEKDKQLNKHYEEVVKQKIFITGEIHSFLRKNISNKIFYINENYIEIFNECFNQVNNIIKTVGISLKDEGIQNFSFSLLTGDEYSINKTV